MPEPIEMDINFYPNDPSAEAFPIRVAKYRNSILKQAWKVDGDAPPFKVDKFEPGTQALGFVKST